MLEGGPDSFLSEKPAALRLCERLGITDRLIGTREEFRRTFVVHDGRLHSSARRLSASRADAALAASHHAALLLARQAAHGARPGAAARPAVGKTRAWPSFVRRRLGREALERVAQPLVGGIYTADPERLSLAATMPRFLDMEREHRSVIPAMWKQSRVTRANAAGSGARWSLFLSFDGGMQTLVDSVARRLPEGVVRCSSTAVRVAAPQRERCLGARRRRRLRRRRSSPLRRSSARNCVSALDSALGTELGSIPYASSATVTLAYRREDIPHPLDGFGFVVPAIEKRRIIACTFSSLKYPGRAPAGIRRAAQLRRRRAAARSVRSRRRRACWPPCAAR